MTFFLFLFFGVFLALILFGIASVNRLMESYKADSIDIGVTQDDINNAEGDTQIERLLDATIKKSKTGFYSASVSSKLNLLGHRLSKAELTLHRLQIEALVFKSMLGGLALIFGLAAAFVALTGEIEGLPGL